MDEKIKLWCLEEKKFRQYQQGSEANGQELPAPERGAAAAGAVLGLASPCACGDGHGRLRSPDLPS